MSLRSLFSLLFLSLLLLSPSFLDDYPSLSSFLSDSCVSLSSASVSSRLMPSIVASAAARPSADASKKKKKKKSDKKKSSKSEEKETRKENSENEENSAASGPSASGSGSASQSQSNSASASLSRSQSARLQRFTLRRSRVQSRNDSIRKSRLQRKLNRKRRISNRSKARKQFIEVHTAALEAATIKRGVQHAARMERLHRRSRSKLISVDSEEFTSLIAATPRYFNTFLIFTALGTEHKCRVCSEVHTIQRRLARFYGGGRQNFTVEDVESQLKGIKVSGLDLSLPEKEWRLRENAVIDQYNALKQSFFPVYFVEVDIQQAQKVFWALEIQTAPLIYYLPPTFQKSAPASASEVPKDFLKRIPAKNRFIAMSSITESQLLEFVNGFLMENERIRTDADGEEGPKGPLARVVTAARDKYSSLDVLTRKFVNVFASVLALGPIWLALSFVAVKIGLKAPTPASAINEALVSPALRYWAVSASSVSSLSIPRAFLIVCSFLLYGFLSGAGMYNTIRGSHLQDNNNWWDYRSNIVGHQGEQYTVESFIIGTFHLLLASIVILINLRAFKRKGLDSAVAEPGASFIQRLSRSRILRRVFDVLDYLISYFINPLILLLVFYWVYREYLSCYTRKHEHYLSHIQTRVDAMGIYGFFVKRAPRWFWKLWRQWRLLSAAHPTTWRLKDITGFIVPILMDPMATIRQLWT